MNRLCCVLLLLAAGVYLAADLAAAWAAEAAGGSPQARFEGLACGLDGPERRTAPRSQRPPTDARLFRQDDHACAWPTMIAKTAYTGDAKARPATIDMTFEGQATLGIYELAGEKLRICLNDLGKGRPAKITTNAGKGCDIDLLLSRADRQWDVLHVMNADGTCPRLLITHPEFTTHGSPEWSLDGKKIGFDACRSIYGEPWSESHIFTCSADGQGIKDLGAGACQAGPRTASGSPSHVTIRPACGS